MTKRFSPGDWVTIRDEPALHRGAHGVVLEIKVSRMSVAYVTEFGVRVRHVRIDSVDPGHLGSGRGLEPVRRGVNESKEAGAREVIALAVADGSIDELAASTVLKSYLAGLAEAATEHETARILADRRELRSWVRDHGYQDLPTPD